MKKYVLAIDAGTTSSRAILFSHGGEIVSKAQKEFTQIYPQPAWVEHDAMEIWRTQKEVIEEALLEAHASYEDIAAIGITNQRETTVVWNKRTGEPIYNAIVWQCRRTTDMIERLVNEGLSYYVRKTTGLVPDPYFSASKIAWILEHVPGARSLADSGDLLFGTIDTWLIWKLTDGAVHVTDVTNASRTMLFDIHNLTWDEKLLEYFDIPRSMLPRVCMSSEIIGEYKGIPIAGVAGDQQAALFGNCSFNAGDAKSTYGTGCFTLINTGKKAVLSDNGLLTTIAYGIDGTVNYALEGSVFIAGAAVQWVRDELHLINSSSDSEACCYAVEDSGGVYIVPAFAGLGAPYWNPEARGSVYGITRGINKNHFVRAVVESIAYQNAELIGAMCTDTSLGTLKVDGGASANNFLLQFQSDILNTRIERPSCIETTALGAAYLAGLATGFWKSKEEIIENRKIERVFEPAIDSATRDALLNGWKRAIKATTFWAEN